MSETKELPEGWEVVKIKDIFVFKGGGTPSKADPSFWDGDIYWASVKDIKGDYLLDTVDKITQKGAENSATNIAEPGDVILITRISPGKTITTKIRSAINQDLKIVIPKYETHSDFIKYLFKSIERKCIKLSSGTTVLGLSLNNLNEIDPPLPPLPEQHRIVAKIEELFSSLDKGIESLKTAQAQLKTYRQAVLKWAFEGKFTNEIVKEGELPAGWKWVKLAGLVGKISDGPFGSNLKTSDYVDIGVRVIRLENIGELKFRNEYKSFVTENKYEKVKNHTVAKGDIIFSSFISERIRTVILPDYIDKAINKADCILVRPNEEMANNKYLVYFFATKSMYHQLVGNIHGATRPRINTSQLKIALIPVAPLLEQHRIVSEIETRLSVCDKLEESINQSLLQAEALRQSILKKAFEDKLVPQNPDDEPASVLLERIRAERASVVAKYATGVDGKRGKGVSNEQQHQKRSRCC